MVDRQATQIIISPAGGIRNRNRRYSKSKQAIGTTIIASPTPSGGGLQHDGSRFRAIQERRERLEAKIAKSRLPPLPTPKKSSSTSDADKQNNLSPTWKEKDKRTKKVSQVAKPPKISIPVVSTPKISIPTVRLTPMNIGRVQHTPPRRDTPQSDNQHEPLPDINHPHKPAGDDEVKQQELQEEMQRQMQELMQLQMQKMQQYFTEQQERQRQLQQQEKEQLMQQLRQQQEEIEKHQQEKEEEMESKEEEKPSGEEDKSTSHEPTAKEDAEEKPEENEDSTEEKSKNNEESTENNDAPKDDDNSDKGNQATDNKENDVTEGESNSKDEDGEDKKQEEEPEEDIGDLANEIVQGMQSHDRRTQISYAEKARQQLSLNNAPVKQLINAGILPVLVQSMDRKDIPDLQLEAAWSVTNIASGASDHTWALVEAGVLPYLIDLMQNGRPNVREQAVWAIGNIVGDGPDCRDEALRARVVPPLVDLLSAAMPIPLRRQVCWVLTNLFRAKNPDISDDDRKLCVNALKDLAGHYDAQVQVDSLWATAYFADLGGEYIDDLINCGIVRELVQRLYSNDDKVVAAALRATGTIAAGNNEQTDAVVEAGALPIYRELLSHPTPGIAREAAWILSNITAGTPKQIQVVIDVQAVSALMAAAEKNDAELRKEATWALSNLTSGGTAEQIWVLVQLGVLACLCGVLGGEDSAMMVVALEAINNIFKKTEDDGSILRVVEGVGGRVTLRTLQAHDQGEVAKLAKYLLETYFEGDPQEHHE